MDIDVYRMLKYDEGEKLISYYCTQGHLTVGVGHNLDADPAVSILKRRITQPGESITQLDSNRLFNKDKYIVYTAIDSNIPDWHEFQEKYQYILVNMCFNMGIVRLLKWKQTLAAMRVNDEHAVINGIMDSIYARQVPNRAKRMCMLAKGIVPHEYS